MQDRILTTTITKLPAPLGPKSTQEASTHLNPAAQRALTRHNKLSVAEMSNCLEQGLMTWTIELFIYKEQREKPRQNETRIKLKSYIDFELIIATSYHEW